MNSLLTFFYSPMVMISLFLHGLFLMMPLPAKPPAEQPPEAEKPEEEVQLTSLQSLTKPSAAPKPIPKAIPKAVPKASPSVPKPIVRPIVAAAARPRLPTAAASPRPSVASAPAQASLAAESPSAAVASPDPQAEQQLQDYLGQFQSSLGAVGASETAGLGIPYYLFPQPELYFTADSLAAADSAGADPVQQEGIEDILWASRKRPDAALEELKVLFQGFTFSEAAEFGGGSVYQVSQGSTVRYVNLVQATDKTATFVVIWNRDPNSAQAAAP